MEEKKKLILTSSLWLASIFYRSLESIMHSISQRVIPSHNMQVNLLGNLLIKKEEIISKFTYNTLCKMFNASLNIRV